MTNNLCGTVYFNLDEARPEENDESTVECYRPRHALADGWNGQHHEHGPADAKRRRNGWYDGANAENDAGRGPRGQYDGADVENGWHGQPGLNGTENDEWRWHAENAARNAKEYDEDGQTLINTTEVERDRKNIVS